MKVKFLAILAAAALAVSCSAQSATADHHAQVFSNQDIAAQLAALTQKAKSAGGSGTILANYSSHKIELSVRTRSGGAEIHAHFDDIFVVTKGRATLVTGGTILNPKTNAATGETEGSGIRGGHTQTISKGDIVNIPAGTPHQVLVPDHKTYSAIVIKVYEP